MDFTKRLNLGDEVHDNSTTHGSRQGIFCFETKSYRVMMAGLSAIHVMDSLLGLQHMDTLIFGSTKPSASLPGSGGGGKSPQTCESSPYLM